MGLNAQDTAEKKGFVFGLAAGASQVSLSYPSKPLKTELSLSVPNIKIGAMISKRMALLVYLPGSIYRYKESGRLRDRGFEAICPSVQYWLKDRWWIMAGAGLGMDAPAFYDIRHETERTFYFGSSLITAAGYELWARRQFAVDVQARAHLSNLNLSEGSVNGAAFSLLIGFNLY